MTRKIKIGLALGSGGARGLAHAGVLDVLEERIQPPPSTLPERLQSWTAGVLVYQGRSVLILDLERLLQDYQAGLA